MDLTKAYALIRKYEGLVLHSYPDPATHGEPYTIGYGTTVYPNGVKVHLREFCTKAQAEEYMEHDVLNCAGKIKKMVHGNCTDNQLAALVSLVYNIGLGAFSRSQLLASINQGKPGSLTAPLFMHFTHAAGHVMAGLVKRRQEEMQVFLS